MQLLIVASFLSRVTCTLWARVVNGAKSKEQSKTVKAMTLPARKWLVLIIYNGIMV